jgi:hypothetical protein
MFAAEVVAGQCLGQLRLADTRGPCKDEAGNGAVGVLQAHTRTADGTADGRHSLLLWGIREGFRVQARVQGR